MHSEGLGCWPSAGGRASFFASPASVLSIEGIAVLVLAALGLSLGGCSIPL